jgi:uncharacterized protein YidB (DUF937 family)
LRADAVPFPRVILAQLWEAAMGMFDGVLGGVVGAGMAGIVQDLIQRHGGLQGIVQQFQRQGLGGTIQSWISTGPNQPIAPDQVHQALGTEVLQELSARTGVPLQELATKLSTILPQAIDKMTPNGTLHS